MQTSTDLCSLYSLLRLSKTGEMKIQTVPMPVALQADKIFRKACS